IYDTIVKQDIPDNLATYNGFMNDIYSTYLAPQEQEHSSHSTYSLGKSQYIVNNSKYIPRIQ
ncbi:phosphoenolpyruvate synthase regulatory protein, partial [Pseudomonas syringae pv. tagetis]